MTDYAAVEALAAGAARGLKAHLQAERPDLAWEVTVEPISRAELAELEARSDYADASARPALAHPDHTQQQTEMESR